MTGWWGNFGNWLNSPQGWIFYVVILVFLVSILANLVGYVARRREGGAKKVGYGGMVALVGAVITLTAIASLPWESYASFSCAECGWSSAGFGYGQGSAAIFVLVTGLLWFTLFGIPRRVAAVLGFAWGVLALVLALHLLAVGTHLPVHALPIRSVSAGRPVSAALEPPQSRAHGGLHRTRRSGWSRPTAQ